MVDLLEGDSGMGRERVRRREAACSDLEGRLSPRRPIAALSHLLSPDFRIFLPSSSSEFESEELSRSAVGCRVTRASVTSVTKLLKSGVVQIFETTSTTAHKSRRLFSFSSFQNPYGSANRITASASNVVLYKTRIKHYKTISAFTSTCSECLWLS